MTRLLRLYPRAWRGRYSAELASILEARPPTLADRFDLVRGSLDAHLHPELFAADSEPHDVRDPASGSAVAGLLIGLGSALWLAGVFTVAVQPLGFGDRDASAFGVLIPIAGVLYAAGVGRLVWSGGVPGRIGAAVIAAFALAIVPMVWPLAVVGYWGLMFSLAVTSVSRAVAGRWPGWLAVAISIAAALGLATNVDTGALWLATLPPVAMAMLALLSLFGRLPAGHGSSLVSERAQT